jgi:cell division protein FtsB
LTVSTPPVTIETVQPSASINDSRRATKTTIKLVVLLSAVLTIVFCVSYFFSEQGISELQRSRRRVADLRSDITRLEQENRRLKAEIESLKKSTFAVERIAREDLGMSRPGETVYILPRKQK